MDADAGFVERLALCMALCAPARVPQTEPDLLEHVIDSG
jgi:hypothetical protein